MEDKKLTRRDFLRLSAVGAAGAVLVACQPQTVVVKETVEVEKVVKETIEVEKEVTKIVEKEKVVTVAPEFSPQQAPMLKAMIETGELPPLEERMPTNPLVVEPLEEVGQYGGTWRRANTGPWGISARIGGDPLVTYDRDETTVIANLASEWEVSDGGKTYTFHLREGAKWSDGQPLTVDDIMFWYEDRLLNKELTPSFPMWLSPGGEPGVIEKIDDFTVRFRFAAPYGLIFDQLCFRGIEAVRYPKHYMKQFHVNYADQKELDAMVSKAGFEQWFQLFGNKSTATDNADIPVDTPWSLTTQDWTTTAFSGRNPYYWKVDTAGNQLPYIDKVFYFCVEDAEIVALHCLAGEIDMQAFKTGFNNYPLYMENAEKGNYEVRIWSYGTTVTSMHVNQAKQYDEGDEAAKEQRELLRNRDFRSALSRAIDRDDLNELLFFGKAGDVLNLYPESVKSDPEIQGLFEYDPEGSNAILDSLGLDKRDAEGMRLLPGGDRLELGMSGSTMYTLHRDVSEVVAGYWRNVGIRATGDWMASELWGPLRDQGKYDIIPYDSEYVDGNLHWLTYPRSYFPVESSTYWAVWWGMYYTSDGKRGEEPTGDGKKLVEIYEQVVTETDFEKRKLLEDEAFRICAWNLWPVNTLGTRPESCIVKNNLKNVRQWGGLAWAVYGPLPGKPFQYFFKRA